MKKLIANIIKCVGAVLLITGSFLPSANVFADGYGITLAPMNQKVVINPGESYETSFKISNPVFQTEDVYYELSVEPFFTNENDEIIFQAEGDSDAIVNWVSFEVPIEGSLKPNEVKEIKFKIDVPENTAAGGQYVSIIATAMSKSEKEGNDSGVTTEGTAATIKEIRRIAHLVYAEITGNTTKSGEITEANVPSFMFGGKITGSSIIKNTGNVHGTAKYTLQVFPLFSGEEVYTNEEEPETKTVMPNRTVYREITWEETPGIGIFNVVYTVEFEGATAQVKKMVIICPIWLLFIIIFAILFAIFYVIAKLKKRSKN